MLLHFSIERFGAFSTKVEFNNKSKAASACSHYQKPMNRCLHTHYILESTFARIFPFFLRQPRLRNAVGIENFSDRNVQV